MIIAYLVLLQQFLILIGEETHTSVDDNAVLKHTCEILFIDSQLEGS